MRKNFFYNIKTSLSHILVKSQINGDMENKFKHKNIKAKVMMNKRNYIKSLLITITFYEKLHERNQEL